MRRHFLIDASALIPFFLNLKPNDEDMQAKSAIQKLLRLKEENKISLYIPNFCMAECSKGFAAIAFEKSSDPEKTEKDYHKHAEALLETVSSRRKGLIRSIGLKRKHLVDVEDIFKADYRLSDRGNKKHLSGLDALVIAIGKTLMKTYGSDNVFIVTKDQRMARVCNENRPFLPKAVYVLKDPVPDQ